MKTYTAIPHQSDLFTVIVDGTPLRIRKDLFSRAPDKLHQQAAVIGLSILADCLEDDEAALSYYQEFTRGVIRQLPAEGWSLTEDEIVQKCMAYAHR